MTEIYTWDSPLIGHTQCAFILPGHVEAVLYLLHGMGGNAGSWLRHSKIETLAARYRLAVLMPDLELSAGHDTADGRKYFSFITSELPARFPLAQSDAFPPLPSALSIPFPREKTLIAGYSMGGYAAFRTGFAFPERFGFIGSFSAGYESCARFVQLPEPCGLTTEKRVFGSAEARLADDDRTRKNIVRASSLPHPPRLYLSCGAQDEDLIDNVRSTERTLAQIGYPHFYIEPDGHHDWHFWSSELPRFLEFAFVPNASNIKTRPEENP